jgi:hypothetical protein
MRSWSTPGSIALYPDDLVAQILMASTYPSRWLRRAMGEGEPNLKGNQLTSALEKQNLDPTSSPS